jgi:repressor LexA
MFAVSSLSSPVDFRWKIHEGLPESTKEARMPVTPRLRQIYDYLCRYSDRFGYAPTIAEIGKQFDMSSPASVHHILSGLEREGLIRRIPNVSRGIEVIREEPSADDSEIPLLGVVAAGQPIEAILSHETISIPRDMLGGSGRLFALRVRGDSMIGEQIREGDFIVCESRQTANNGQTVVALVDRSDATVKRFYKERDSVRLEPANPKYKPIIVKADRVTIQGIVKGLIRKYHH